MNDVLMVLVWSILNSSIVFLKNLLLKTITSEELFILQTFSTVVFICLFILFYKPISNYTSAYHKIIKTNKLHLMLFLLTVCYILFSIVNNEILTYTDISRMVIMSNIMYLLIVTIVSSYLENIPITFKKAYALFLLCVAMYILNT